MLPSIRTLFLILFFLTLTNILRAQDSSSLIYVEIPGLTIERGFADVRQSLSPIREIIGYDYCTKLGIAIFKINGDQQTTKLKIAKALSKNHYSYYIKNNISQEKLNRYCELKF